MAARSSTPSPAMWAGVECTVNRIGDRYFDQLARTGHDVRVTDLDLIAGLGVRTVRYPVLWERTAPTTLGSADWSWPDVRLARLRDLGITPIVGLVHHGSGPVHTSVLDPQFPELLAEYAAAIAARYPWLSLFTPVNEPLTTARFACLYGHWYPHAHDDVSFLRALLHQCKASVLAMRAIRRVRPDAKLIVTEDLGATHSTPQLAYQAAFENARRWLSIDLLCGRIDHTHPLYAWMRGQAITAAELEYFAVNATPPDIIGFNYYLTSERWLDDDCARWPTSAHGGNGRDRYADVHAVLAGQMGGIEPLLRTAWERYGVPLALTEVHLGGTREEQMRWLVEIYDAASRVCASGIDVRAVTAWSLFGCYDWHCLVTRDEGFYEPGVFDVRGPAPRPTALARVVRDLASGVRPDHPVLAHPGFWHRREVA